MALDHSPEFCLKLLIFRTWYLLKTRHATGEIDPMGDATNQISTLGIVVSDKKIFSHISLCQSKFELF